MIQIHFSSTPTYERWLLRHQIEESKIKQHIREKLRRFPDLRNEQFVIVFMKNRFKAKIHFIIQELSEYDGIKIVNVKIFSAHSPI